MNIDFEKITIIIKQLVSNYIHIFVEILTSPKQAFPNLLNTQKEEKYIIVKPKKLDSQPFIYAAISLLIGLILGSSLSIKDAPTEITTSVITETIVPYLFLWLLSSLAIHFLAKLFKGKGKIVDSIASVLYVLGTLHPLLLILIYIVSAVYPDSLSYNLTLRDPTGYFAGPKPEWTQVNIIGINFRLSYYFVSSVLTAIYLYFPLSFVHKLSFIKMLIMYVIVVLIIAIPFLLIVGPMIGYFLY